MSKLKFELVSEFNRKPVDRVKWTAMAEICRAKCAGDLCVFLHTQSDKRRLDLKHPINYKLRFLRARD